MSEVANVPESKPRLTYRQSETIGEYAKAWPKAQLAMMEVTKDRVAKVEPKDKKAYTYNYADLGSVIDAVREALANNGFGTHQFPTTEQKGDREYAIVTTKIQHTSGEFYESDLRMAIGGYGKPQETGSAITYARRYALQAMCGIASVDDDGAAASALPPGKTNEQTKAQIWPKKDAAPSPRSSPPASSPPEPPPNLDMPLDFEEPEVVPGSWNDPQSFFDALVGCRTVSDIDKLSAKAKSLKGAARDAVAAAFKTRRTEVSNVKE